MSAVIRKEEKSTGRLHKDGGVAVNVLMKSECCPLRLEEKSTGTPPQRWWCCCECGDVE